jgi:hypothetical protein
MYAQLGVGVLKQAPRPPQPPLVSRVAGQCHQHCNLFCNLLPFRPITPSATGCNPL